MNKVGNTYLVNNRLRSQRVVARSSNGNTRRLAHSIIGTKTDVRRRGGIVPSWVFLSMILLALVALCLTVTIRFQMKANAATKQNEEINKEIDSLRGANSALQDEVKRLRTDPRTIETAARTRLNMVRENEIIVPVE